MKKLSYFILFTLISFLAEAQSSDKAKKRYQCPCPEIGLEDAWASEAGVNCYKVPVSRDVAQPEGKQFKMAVAIAQSKKPTKNQPVLYLHGGPGIATLDNLPKYLKSEVWKTIGQEHDLIFFDYRATGYSEPALCLSVTDSMSHYAASHPDPLEQKQYWNALLADCKEKLSANGIELNTFSSLQSAADANEIRKALGIKKWSVYGVSHGTTVALNIIRHAEQSIESVILDSAFPPNAPWVDFVRPFNECFSVLEKNIAEDPQLTTQFSNLRKDFATATKTLNEKPATLQVPTPTDTLQISYTGSEFAWGIWQAMLNPKYIPLVPLSITEVANGNQSFLLDFISLFNDPNKFGAFSPFQSMAILCYEGMPQTPQDADQILKEKYPEFAALLNNGFEENCKNWQPATAPSANFDPVVSNLPVLILAGELDPVCPPKFGELAAQTLKNSLFINVPAASHAAISADACTINIANEFINNRRQKINSACVQDRQKIQFVTQDLPGEISKLLIKK